MNRLALTTGTLVQRELVRFLRQKHRWAGALATPLIFWLFLGSGLGQSFRAPQEGMTYLQYILPGTMALVCLFTAVFSTISIIEDRHAGLLQAVLVSPAPRAGIVLGKMGGAAALAFVQAALFLLLLPVLGVPVTLQVLHGEIRRLPLAAGRRATLRLRPARGVRIGANEPGAEVQSDVAALHGSTLGIVIDARGRGDRFRVGVIGRIFPSDVRALLCAIQATLEEMEILLGEGSSPS